MSAKRPLSTHCTSISTFDANGKLDTGALSDHYARIADAGIGLYVGGPAAEGWNLTPTEVRRSLEIALHAAGTRVPVYYMGVEPRHAGELLEQARVARDCGVHAFQVYSVDIGHGQIPGPSEIEWHFRDLLEAVEVDCVLSSHYYEGYVLDPELMRRLTDDYPHVVGFVVTNPDTFYLAAVMEALPTRVEVHIGGPMQALEALAMGASGYLSTISNFAPELCQRVISCYAAGDYDDCHAAWYRLLRLKRCVYASGGNPAPLVKVAMEVLGRPGTGLRSPHLPAEDGVREAIAAGLEEFRRDID